jgi:6-phosphogluconolactonase/glucosamine-6-phosphate isomerase/deaminase
MIMANGESKAGIVKRLVSEEINEKLPATVLRKHSYGLLWIDKAAAADL